MGQFSTPADYSKPGRAGRAMMRMGLGGRDQMFWWWSDEVNFGDWIGPLLYEWRTGRRPVWRNSFGSGRGRYHVSVGSVMSYGHRPGDAIFWGSGTINPVAPIAAPAEIRAVRGPLTRARCVDLGYDCPEVYGDPGILVSRVLPAGSATPRYRLGIVLHYDDAAAMGEPTTVPDDVLVIDVRRSVQAVAADIADCAAVVSSSLHGLILAHAYDRPAAWIGLEQNAGGDRAFKFRDYYAAFGITDVTAPSLISSLASVDALLKLVEQAPVVDVTPLQDPLLATCPF